MSENKTKPTTISPRAFVEGVEPARRREDGLALLDMFTRVTGFEPRMWGPSIIGFGRYDYTYKSGRTGSWFATGFAPRKAKLSIYIMPGYADFGHILTRLGKHKMGQSCLYLNKLDDVDMDVLAELVRAGLDNLATQWPVHAT